jgi:hypothetical protein
MSCADGRPNLDTTSHELIRSGIRSCAGIAAETAQWARFSASGPDGRVTSRDSISRDTQGCIRPALWSWSRAKCVGARRRTEFQEKVSICGRKSVIRIFLWDRRSRLRNRHMLMLYQGRCRITFLTAQRALRYQARIRGCRMKCSRHSESMERSK